MNSVCQKQFSIGKFHLKQICQGLSLFSSWETIFQTEVGETFYEWDKKSNRLDITIAHFVRPWFGK